ncbi:Tripartite ATP-independent transporter, DctQ component, partial [Propionivibrio dicarboxylicus]
MFSRLLLKSLEWLLICIFGLMVLLVFGNVVLRYGFNYGIIFSEEVSRFLFVWMVFLG